MNITLQIIFILLAYLLGAVPFSYILTKYHTGKNILEIGSGNAGSTNVKRVAGKKVAILVQLLDMFKGLFPVALYYVFADRIMFPDFYVYLLALAAIIGHDFSIFLKFKGGKGVNTTLGASLLIVPVPVLISVAVYFIVKWRFKYVSLGSVLLAVSLPVCELILHQQSPSFYYLLVCMILILALHHKNIKRLLNKNELLP